MKVHEFYSTSRTQFVNPAVTIGVFDGVHNGHRHLLNVLKHKAFEHDGETVVLTLWPHPRMVLQPDKEIRLLNTLEEKTVLFEKEGIDHLVMLNFTNDVARMGAEDFVRNILLGRLGMKAWIIGFDNHFGKDRSGNYETIHALSTELGFSIEHPEASFQGPDRVSSTTIRVQLEMGDVEKAASLLGYQYTLTGLVIEGKRLGHTIGFPTANLQPAPLKMVPGIGVYAVWVDVGTKRFPGMLNIGFRPTFSSHTLYKSIEVHLIGYDGDLYNREITLTFVKKLRDERKFENIEKLSEQLEKDKQTVVTLLNI